MKNTKNNINLLEKIVRTMSKGYYSNFNEYHPDHTKPDDANDHSKEIEKNDHTIEIEKNDDTESSPRKKRNRKKKVNV